MLEQIIARSNEKKELESYYKSPSPEFLAMYGRRRVGKTYLIRNFFKAKSCVYFQVTGLKQGSLEAQLDRFAKALGETFYDGVKIEVANSWIHAFDQLTDAITKQPKNRKVVLFLDELPWLATPKSGLLEALDHFWNHKWSADNRIKLIVCGSSASWIIKKILKNKGGLHNRVTRKIRLKPFDFIQTKEFLSYLGLRLNDKQILKLYMCLGGVPFYLKQCRKSFSVDQNINRLFFTEDAPLLEEFDDVFDSLFTSSEQYKSLVKTIGGKHSGVFRTEVESSDPFSSKGGGLTDRLEDLVHAGFISNFISHDRGQRGLSYRLSDPFCLFYLKWVAPHIKRIQTGSMKDIWKGIIDTPSYFSWSGYAFENFCWAHLEKIKDFFEIPSLSIAAPWQYISKKDLGDDGAQIDLLFDRSDDAITLCEIKFTKLPFVVDKAYADKLQRKVDVFKKQTKTDKQIIVVFISACGLKETMYSEALVEKCMTLENFT